MYNSLISRLAIGWFLVLSASTGVAEEAEPSASASVVPVPAFEEVIALRRVRAATISPDGRSVAFEVRTVDWQANRFDREIWLAYEGREPFQLTRTADGNSSRPRWSPDGQWIAFLAERGEKVQVHALRAVGGEAQVLTAAEEGVEDFAWMPDGRSLVYAAAEKDAAAEKRDKRYGAFAIEDKDYSLTHLWQVAVVTDPLPAHQEVYCPSADRAEEEKADEAEAVEGEDEDEEGVDDCPAPPKPKRLTEGDFTVSAFRPSPDGTRIALERGQSPLVRDYVSGDIAVLDVESGVLTTIVADPGYDGGPVWSPDGTFLLYSSAAGNTTSDFYENNQIYKIPAAGGTAVRLAADFDEQIYDFHWTPTGIYFTAWQRTERQLFRLDPESGQTSLVANRPQVISGLDFSADGTAVAFIAYGPTSRPEVHLGTTDPFIPRTVTATTKAIESWDVGRSEVVSWTSRDGARIEGVLHKPSDFDPAKRYPLLVVIHGGPSSLDVPQPVPGYVYPIVQWLQRGAVVLRPNYRGSAGYGAAFRALNVRNLGVGDAWDVLTGVDHLVAQGWVDEARMGAMGWSQGGYISAFLTTTSERFQAISVGAGIANWTTYYVNTDIHPFTRQYLQATPWDDAEIYARTSPITYVKQAQTPTLIQHGEFDRRVPIPNAYELFQGLQDQGVDAELIVYTGFGHGISKPKELLAATWHNWQWFARYIWGEEVELP